LGNNFYFISELGYGYSLGANSQSQRCNGFGGNPALPILMVFENSAPKRILHLSAGSDFVMIITADGLYGCGSNYQGFYLLLNQLGILAGGNTVQSNQFVPTIFGSEIPILVSAGIQHTVVYDSKFQLKTFGDNSKGQLVTKLFLKKGERRFLHIFSSKWSSKCFNNFIILKSTYIGNTR
jgi:alpha-tubulin suppressor-like RCC1 family protein